MQKNRKLLFTVLPGMILFLVIGGCSPDSSHTSQRNPNPSDSELNTQSEVKLKNSEGKRYVPVPPDWLNHVGLSPATSINITLASWLKAERSESKISIDKDMDFFKDGIIDCTKYHLDDRFVSAIRNSKEVKWLRVGSNARSEDISWISTLKNLEALSLGGADLRSADLAQLKSLKNLRWLDLTYTKLPKDSSQLLNSFAKLEVAFLDGYDFDDSWLPSVTLPSLQVVTIGGSKITDTGLTQCLRLNSKLRHLYIARCSELTSSLFEELCQLQDLRYLHIGSTPLEQELNDNDYYSIDATKTVDSLRLALPNCHIGTGS